MRIATVLKVLEGAIFTERYHMLRFGKELDEKIFFYNPLICTDRCSTINFFLIGTRQTCA